MYRRIGYMDLLGVNGYIIGLLEVLIIFGIILLCHFRIVKVGKKLVQDYNDGKRDKLEVKVLKHRDFCNMFTSIPKNKSARYTYDMMCCLKALLELEKGNEKGFLSELKKCKTCIYFVPEDIPDPERELEYVKIIENVKNAVIKNMGNDISKSSDLVMEKDYIHMEGIDSNKNVVKNDKNTKKKKIWIMVFIVAFIVYGLIDNSVQWKGAFRAFSQPEDVYTYRYPDNELQLILDGKESKLLIGTGENQQDLLMVKQSDDKWKLAIGADIEVRMERIGSIVCYLYEYDELDYYLVIDVIGDENCEMFDPFDTEFVQVQSKVMPIGTMHCAYIEDYSEDYWVSINGTEVTFEGN